MCKDFNNLVSQTNGQLQNVFVRHVDFLSVFCPFHVSVLLPRLQKALQNNHNQYGYKQMQNVIISFEYLENFAKIFIVK